MFFVQSLSCNSSFNIKDSVSFVGPTREASYFKLQQQSFNSSTTRHLYFRRLPRLWNAHPRVNHDYGTPSREWTKIMEHPPTSGPKLWNALPRVELSLQISTKMIKEFLWSKFIENFNINNLCTFHFVCPCNRCSKLSPSLIYSSQSWAMTLYLMGKDPLPTHYYLHVCACPH